MVDPYLCELLIPSLNVESDHTQNFISEIVQHLTVPTLIKLTKQTYKKVDNLVNYSLWFKQVSKRGVSDYLNKTLLLFLNRCLVTFIENEHKLDEIERLNAQIFMEISLKINEHQLRKFIIDLVRWSEMKFEVIEELPFNYRKIVVAKIYCIMS